MGQYNGNDYWQDPFVTENIMIDASSSLTVIGIFINNSKNE
ncbi:MAG: hypothetical protein ACFFCI_01255 [Promethearchaeota archaeon]